MAKHVSILVAFFAATVGSTALAYNDDCQYYPEHQRMDVVKFQERLQKQGWRIRKFEVSDDNCYEITGWNPQGQRVEADFDAKTGRLVRSERD